MDPVKHRRSRDRRGTSAPPTPARRLLIGGLIAGVAAVAALGIANWWVLHEASPFIRTTSSLLPVLDVGLFPGTSPTLADGSKNPFFAGRVATAAMLYKLKTVKHVLVSGDNSRKAYDEPSAMRDALVAAGVPATAITLDYAGFHTLDSMARAKSVFGLQRLTVITDDFHLPRAVFLARAQGIDAYGFPAGRVPLRWSVKTRTREVFARLKACLDVYVLHTQPKFSGPPEPLTIAGDAAP